MKAFQPKQNHSISREVMDLLSPRITSGTTSSHHLTSTTSTSASMSNKSNHRSSHQNSAPLPPMIPTYPKTIKKNIKKLKNSMSSSNNEKEKKVVSVKPARKWLWAPFASSARTDGALFYHWVRAGVEYPDYPYARFDIHMDTIRYTDEEYEQHLNNDPAWTKTDTDRLFELVRVYELRWPIIHDRWLSQTKDTAKNRPIHHLQHRYYKATTILNRIRLLKAATVHATASTAVGGGVAVGSHLHGGPNSVGNMAGTTIVAGAGDTHAQKVKQVANNIVEQQAPIHSLGTGTSTMEPFNLEQETERRKQLELLWNRPKEEEQEEIELRKELKLVEAQIRKLKKSGSHLLQRGANVSANNNFSSNVPNANLSSSNFSQNSGNSNNSNRTKPLPTANFDQAFAATAPIPTPGIPYLQSARLATPATGGHMGLNKSLIQKMDSTLKELKVPERPSCPTKRVCDLFDSVRKNTLILLSLEKIAVKKEGEVIVKRKRLEQMKNNVGHLSLNTPPGLNPGAAMKKTVVVAGAQMKQPPVVNAGKRSMSIPLNNMPPPAGTAPVASLPRSKASGSSKNKRRSSSSSKSSKITNTSALDPNVPNPALPIGMDTPVPATTTTTKKGTKRKSKKVQASSASIAAAAAAVAAGINPNAINPRTNTKAMTNLQKNKGMAATTLPKQGPMTSKSMPKKGMPHSNMPLPPTLPPSTVPMPMANLAMNKNMPPLTTVPPGIPNPGVGTMPKAGTAPGVMMKNMGGQVMNINTKGNLVPNNIATQDDGKPSKKRSRKS